MHIGTSYKLTEFLVWTRRSVYVLIPLGVIPVVLYENFGFKWLNVPWPVIALLGTATAFIVGFKNTQTYNRAVEAHSVWTTISGLTRCWGLISREFLSDPVLTKDLIYRHLAWLTSLRYEMRSHRAWETVNKKHNSEYQKYYAIPERQITLSIELAKYLSEPELKCVLLSENKPTKIMSLQSKMLKRFCDNQQLGLYQFIDMERNIKDLLVQQARSEQIKDVPYPRQYAVINTLFVWIFCFLLPFGMLKEFDELNEVVTGLMAGNMVWLVVPFSAVICWMYTSLEQVGESTENPFEGNANDVPISKMCRTMEIELRELLGESDLPPKLKAQNDIIL